MNVTHCATALVFAALACAAAAPLLPTADGTTWQYELRELPPDEDGAATLSVRIAGTEELAGKQLLKLETRAGGLLTKTELIGVDDNGIHCYRRTDEHGEVVSLERPLTILPLPLKIGAKWEVSEQIGKTAIREEFTILAQEIVDVPAGTYHAFRLHTEQPWPISSTIDRWFVPEVGFVKEVTASRGPNGRLLSRSTLVLVGVSHTAATATPTATPRPAAAGTTAPPASPQPSTPPAPPEIQLEVATEREGEPVTQLLSEAPNVFVRWAGKNLPLNAIVRVAWVAEDVGDVAPPNFIVDDTETTVTQPEYGARFTLSRPKDGWAEGRYRVDLYIDELVIKSVGVVITD
ncbi:hypothetical protein BH18VER1_BH18VER1_16470 [soil metagenome]